MRLLAHVCCAWCWLACAPEWDRLVGPQGQWEAFFFNPNIHPLLEFRRRLKSVQVLAEARRWPLRAETGYGLRQFLREVDWQGTERCAGCYRLRLRATARAAREGGFDHLTTTLLASTHQDHDLIRRVGEEAAREVGLTFVAEDWRAAGRRVHQEARPRTPQLYRQQYCGCIFSEFERYRDTHLHLYRGPGGPAQDRHPRAPSTPPRETPRRRGEDL